jgi:hypothetical protein
MTHGSRVLKYELYLNINISKSYYTDSLRGNTQDINLLLTPLLKKLLKYKTKLGILIASVIYKTLPSSLRFYPASGRLFFLYSSFLITSKLLLFINTGILTLIWALRFSCKLHGNIFRSAALSQEETTTLAPNSASF